MQNREGTGRNPEAEALEDLQLTVLAWVRAQANVTGRQVVSVALAAEDLGVAREAVYAIVEDLARNALVDYIGAGPKVRLADAGLRHLETAERRRMGRSI